MNDSLGVLKGHSEICLTVNGESVSEWVPVRRNLADFLSLDLGLTGTHVGCEHGVYAVPAQYVSMARLFEAV